MQREGLVHRTWFAQVKEVISSILRVQNYCSIWSLLFSDFGVVLTVWSGIQPQGAFFFYFIIILQNFQVHFFHFALCTSQNTDELLPWNWYRHNIHVSTTLKFEKNMCTASWDWMAFQTASAAQSEQKWRSNETIISDAKIGNYRQRRRLMTENQDMLLRGRWTHQGRWGVSQSGWWRWQTNGGKEKEDVVQ